MVDGWVGRKEKRKHGERGVVCWEDPGKEEKRKPCRGSREKQGCPSASYCRFPPVPPGLAWPGLLSGTMQLGPAQQLEPWRFLRDGVPQGRGGGKAEDGGQIKGSWLVAGKRGFQGREKIVKERRNKGGGNNLWITLEEKRNNDILKLVPQKIPEVNRQLGWFCFLIHLKPSHHYILKLKYR